MNLYSSEIKEDELTHLYFQLRENGVYGSIGMKFSSIERITEMSYNIQSMNLRGHMHNKEGSANWMVVSEAFAEHINVQYNENSVWNVTEEK